MIINSTLSYDLTLGQGQRVPTQDDTTVLVPPIVQPVVLSLFPHDRLVGTGVVMARSFLRSVLQQRTPAQPQITLPLVILAPGLWELEFTMASVFDYSGGAAGVNIMSFNLNYMASTEQILCRHAAIGSFTDAGRYRLLLRENGEIQINNPITAAAQNNQAVFTLNAIRIL